jgi:hypothetical protein
MVNLLEDPRAEPFRPDKPLDPEAVSWHASVRSRLLADTANARLRHRTHVEATTQAVVDVAPHGRVRACRDLPCPYCNGHHADYYADRPEDDYPLVRKAECPLETFCRAYRPELFVEIRWPHELAAGEYERLRATSPALASALKSSFQAAQRTAARPGVFDPGRKLRPRSGPFSDSVWLEFCDRHRAGDHGEYGDLTSVTLTAEHRTAADLFGVLVMNAVAVERGAGLVLSRYLTTPELRAGWPGADRCSCIDVATMLGPDPVTIFVPGQADFNVDPAEWANHCQRQVAARPANFDPSDWSELVGQRLSEQADGINRAAEAYRTATSDLDSGLRPIDHNELMIAMLKAQNQRSGYGLGRGAPSRPMQILGR